MRLRQEKVSVYAVEQITAPFERIIRRLWMALIIMAFLLVGTVFYIVGWDTETIVVSQEAENEEGDNVLINNSGGLNYGETEAEGDNKKESP